MVSAPFQFLALESAVCFNDASARTLAQVSVRWGGAKHQYADEALPTRFARLAGLRRSVVLSAVLAACNLLTTEDDPRRPPDLFDKVRAIDLVPRFPQQTGPPRPAARQRDARQLSTARECHERREQLASVVGAQPAPNGDGYELNFENTPVTTVAKVILGDILGPATRSIRASRAPSPSRPAGRFRRRTCCSSWKMRCASAASCWCATSAATAAAGDRAAGGGSGRRRGASRAGLRHHGRAAAVRLGADDVKLLDSFALKAGRVRVDTARNLMIVQGSGSDRRNAVETVLSFDVDWMRGQSVGIYPLRNSAPEPMISRAREDHGERARAG